MKERAVLPLGGRIIAEYRSASMAAANDLRGRLDSINNRIRSEALSLVKHRDYTMEIGSQDVWWRQRTAMMPKRVLRLQYMAVTTHSDAPNQKLLEDDLAPKQFQSGESIEEQHGHLPRKRVVVSRDGKRLDPLMAAIRPILAQADIVSQSLKRPLGLTALPMVERLESSSSTMNAQGCVSVLVPPALHWGDSECGIQPLPVYVNSAPLDFDCDQYLSEVTGFVTRRAHLRPDLFKDTFQGEDSKGVFVTLLWSLFVRYFQYDSIALQDALQQRAAKHYFRLGNALNALARDEPGQPLQRLHISTRVRFRDEFMAIYSMLLASLIRHFFLVNLAPHSDMFNENQFRMKLESDVDEMLTGNRKSHPTLSRLRCRAFDGLPALFDRQVRGKFHRATSVAFEMGDERPEGIEVAHSSTEGVIGPGTISGRRRGADLHWGGLGRPAPKLPIENEMIKSTQTNVVEGLEKTFPPRVAFDVFGVSPMMSKFAGRSPMRPVVLKLSDSLASSLFGGSTSTKPPLLTKRTDGRVRALEDRCQALRKSISLSALQSAQQARHGDGVARQCASVQDRRVYAEAIYEQMRNVQAPGARARMDDRLVYPVTSNATTGHTIRRI